MNPHRCLSYAIVLNRHSKLTRRLIEDQANTKLLRQLARWPECLRTARGFSEFVLLWEELQLISSAKT